MNVILRIFSNACAIGIRENSLALKTKMGFLKLCGFCGDELAFAIICGTFATEKFRINVNKNNWL
jgi:hypothetical protein